MSISLAKSENKASQEHPSHKILHEPTSNEAANGQINQEKLYSKGHNLPQKSAWYAMFDNAQLPRNVTTDGLHFSVPDTISRLWTIKMVHRTPVLEVAPEFQASIRVAWTPNLAYALLLEGRMHIQDNELYPINGHTLAAFYKCQHPDDATHQFIIGNRESLLEFKSKIVADEVGCPHPWWFSLVRGGLNINLQPNVYFKYQVQDQCMQLVRFQKLNKAKNEWELVETKDYEEKWLVSIPEIPPPDLNCTCTINKGPEMNNYREIGTKQSYPMTEILHDKQENTCKAGAAVKEPSGCMDKCKAVLALSENVTAREKFNIHHIYIVDGKDPISLEVKYDTRKRSWDDIGSVLTMMTSREHFGKVPEIGLHAIAFCMDPFSEPETAVNLKHPQVRGVAHVKLRKDLPSSVEMRVHFFFVAQRIIGHEITRENVMTVIQ